jgi:3-dehydroquinate synthase
VTVGIAAGEGLLDAVGARAARVARPGPCLLVTDRRVGRLYGARTAASLRRAGFAPRVLAVAPGERSKTMATAERILRALAAAGADRETPVIALGGGVVTDLAGFAAAVYARGVPWIAVPTTLLGMADAAIGGKTGVDLPEGKNLAGAFHAPLLVLIDPEVLRTLPRRHLRNGLAEIAKTRLLGGLRRGLPALAALARRREDLRALGAAAARAARAKSALVARDPRETRGVRVLLNLGHTVGHALEAATGYSGRLLHGEAVAIGTVAAARVAEGRGLLRAGEADRVAEALRDLGLPVAPPRGLGAREVLRFVGVDKKRVGGGIRMVLPRNAARPVVVRVEHPEIAHALR